jgi:FkbM family methyltransferase
MTKPGAVLLFLALSATSIGLIFYDSLGSIGRSTGGEAASTAFSWNNNNDDRRKLVELVSTNPAEKWNPVNCPALLALVNDGQVWDPNKNHLLGRWTTTTPPFFVAMNEWGYDKMRKVIYDSGEYYEFHLTKTFNNILKHAPAHARVVDVGGNIGWFTMVSAAGGHHIDVFEPNKVNIIRQCQSMWLNRWENAEEDEILARTNKKGSINIHPYGVGANTTTMTFYVGKNPGKATMVRKMLPAKNKPRDTSTIHIVTLDSLAQDRGWFENKIPIAILKVDVEGFEPSVFVGAKKLLRAGLIWNILMEVSGQDDNTENEAMMQLIMDSGYRLHQVGGPEGPGKGGGNVPPNDANFAKTVMENFAKKEGMQANLWWKWKGMDDDVGDTP